MISEIIIFLVTSFVAYFYYTYKKMHWHFDRNGVMYLPGVPLFGNMLRSSMMRRHFIDDLADVYKAFPDERYVGLLENTSPVILIRDPEIIKSITVKDFDHFVDHKQFFPEEVDTLFGGSVFQMRGDKWRDMRTTLSPAFTGSKMRLMMPFMTDISNNVVAYLKENPTDDVDMGDVIRRYTNDVIASAAFGLQVNSVKEKDNEFYKMGQGLFNFTTKQRIQLMILALFPEFAKKVKLRIFPEKVANFFRKIVNNTIDFRTKNNVERPDMIQLLMEASKGTLKHTNTTEKDDVGFATVQEALKPQGNVRQWTLDELTGQVFIFFIAGFESSASGLVLSIHELAINPEIQEKLYQEIKDFQEKNKNLTYDNVNELKYLDGVLNETFRKWAAALILDRLCTKAYELPPPREGGKPYLIKPGDVVYNVVNPMHMDPKHFPDPHKFDPERFSDENKHKIKPFTFMPFGLGPRNCIGSRFAILELKVMLYNLILNFKVFKCSKTTDPIVLDNADFNVRVKGGSFVKLEARN